MGAPHKASDFSTVSIARSTPAQNPLGFESNSFISEKGYPKKRLFHNRLYEALATVVQDIEHMFKRGIIAVKRVGNLQIFK